MKSDSTLRNSKPPRGLILSTGEDTPRGQSLRARMLILELSPNTLDWEHVTRCQRSASDGLYARAMAGYLRWLAARYSEIRENMPEKISTLRAEASGSEQHRRTPEIVANLTLGMRYFLRFAQKVGAVSAHEAHELKKQSWRALGSAERAQDRHQRAENPALRFVELIRSTLATGRAHLADAETGDSNKDMGECIGWTSGDCVLLDPDVAFATAQKLAQDQGEFITVGQKTLWQRMRDRGLLVRSDAERNLVRMTVGGQRRRVAALV